MDEEIVVEKPIEQRKMREVQTDDTSESADGTNSAQNQPIFVDSLGREETVTDEEGGISQSHIHSESGGGVTEGISFFEDEKIKDQREDEVPPAGVQIVVKTSNQEDNQLHEENLGTEIDQNSSTETAELPGSSREDSLLLGELKTFTNTTSGLYDDHEDDSQPLDDADREIREIETRRQQLQNASVHRSGGNGNANRGSGSGHLHVSSPITISGHATIPSDDDQTNSTISTMEANNTTEEIGLNRSEDDVRDDLLGGQDDYSSLTGNTSTLDWLNNQVAVAISSGVLQITCKQLRGDLHLDKFGSGNRGKCLNAYSQWFTPTEFEAFAGRAQCKDWKRSIRFQGRPLLQLIELGILKVHAVSCTCSACWNGDSAGPVRLHDTKRKTSSLHSALHRESLHGQKRTSYQSLSADSEENVIKQMRIDSNSGSTSSQQANSRSLGTASKPTVTNLRLIQPAEKSSTASVNLSNASLVRSPGGTVRLSLSTSSGDQSRASNQATTPTATTTALNPRSLQLASNQLTLLIPQGSTASSPTKSAQSGGGGRKQTMYVPVNTASTSSGTQQTGIPLGLTYAPVQLASTQNHPVQRQSESSQSTSTSTGGVTIISADLNDHWSSLEEFANNLQQQVNALNSLVYLSRQKTDKALQELYMQVQGEMAKENQRLKQALTKAQTQLAQCQNQNEQQEARRTHQKLCVNCNRSATMTCAVCQSTFYCSEFCVRRDAPMHREKCSPKGLMVEMVNID